jgi:hypothetical protein
MEFRTVTIVKHPTALVWETMQEHLPEIASAVPDIESVSPMSSSKNEEGHLLMVNVWKAKPPLPDFLSKMVQPDMLTWTDSAVWKEAQRSCRWEIRSHYFKEQMSCIGNTSFEPAMGGKACRLSFEGTLHWQANALPIKMAGPLVAQGIESFMASMIPANFRKLTEAVEHFIQNNKLE